MRFLSPLLFLAALTLSVAASPMTNPPPPANGPAGAPVRPIRGLPHDFLFERDNRRAAFERQVLNELHLHPPLLTVPEVAAAQVTYLSHRLADNPTDPQLWSQRCFMRGLVGRDLDAAISDCDEALSLKPGTVAILDRRAMILYLQGHYAEALAAYDDILTMQPDFAASLLMRGYTRGKLGDASGRDADIEAARAVNAGIMANYTRLGIRD